MRILSVKAQVREQSEEPLETVINRFKEVAVQYLPPRTMMIFLISLTIFITIDVMASTMLTMTQEINTRSQ